MRVPSGPAIAPSAVPERLVLLDETVMPDGRSYAMSRSSPRRDREVPRASPAEAECRTLYRRPRQLPWSRTSASGHQSRRCRKSAARVGSLIPKAAEPFRSRRWAAMAIQRALPAWDDPLGTMRGSVSVALLPSAGEVRIRYRAFD